MVRPMTETDVGYCAEILCSVYNNEMWQCKWNLDTATAYLKDYFEAKKFAGFVSETDGQLCGAIFCHEKIWWNNSELLIDELFIRPDLQRKGHGTALLKAAEDYVRSRRLAGFTLTTNRYAPAPEFYKKNGFSSYGHILFMGKEIG